MRRTGVTPDGLRGGCRSAWGVVTERPAWSGTALLAVAFFFFFLFGPLPAIVGASDVGFVILVYTPRKFGRIEHDRRRESARRSCRCSMGYTAAGGAMTDLAVGRLFGVPRVLAVPALHGIAWLYRRQ